MRRFLKRCNSSLGVRLFLVVATLLQQQDVAATLLAASTDHYSVTATRVSDEPVMTKVTNPGFDFLYNPASFTTLPGADGGPAQRWLMVRCENKSNGTHGAWAYGGPSVFAVVRELDDSGSKFGALSVVFGDGVQDIEDPRIVFEEDTGTYWMTYTASDASCSYAGKPNACARLAMASTKNPLSATGWTHHGPLFGDLAGNETESF